MYISLMISDVEHLLIYQLALCVYFFGNMFIQFLCPFFNQIAFLLLSYMSSLYILDISPLSDM